MKKDLLEKMVFVEGLRKPGRTCEGEEGRDRCSTHVEYRSRSCVFTYSFTEQMLVCINLILASVRGATRGAVSNTCCGKQEQRSLPGTSSMWRRNCGKLGWTGARGSRIETNKTCSRTNMMTEGLSLRAVGKLSGFLNWRVTQ